MTRRGLTAPEKAAGRVFRERCHEYLEYLAREQPVEYTVPTFVGLYRHACPAREYRSTALECREWYIPSPAFLVDRVELTVMDLADVPEELSINDFSAEGIPAGRFGFIYRAGTCRGCGATARSRTGRLVDGWDRPPIHGRVARS